MAITILKTHLKANFRKELTSHGTRNPTRLNRLIQNLHGA